MRFFTLIKRAEFASYIIMLPLTLGLHMGCTPKAGEPQTPAAPPARIVSVDVAEVASGTMQETVEGIGTLRALEEVEIRPELAGLIEEVAFKEGGQVKQGDLLFRIRDEKLQRQLDAQQANLDAAKAGLNLALRTLDRVKLLRERGSATPEEFDEANAQVQGDQAEVGRIESELAYVVEQLKDARILAPFDGKIDQRLVDVGNYVNVGQTLTKLFRTDMLEIEFTLPERFMGRIREGQTVETYVAAFPDRPFVGTVSFISPAVNESTRDFIVKSQIQNEGGYLSPGAFGRSKVTVEVFENRPIIPEESLVTTRSGYIVYVVEDNVAQSREVKIGLRQPGIVEIREGVSVGEMVVRTGHQNLNNGSQVSVVGGEDDAEKTGGEVKDTATKGAQP